MTGFVRDICSLVAITLFVLAVISIADFIEKVGL